MPIHEAGDRLARLYALRDRVAAEIARLEDNRARLLSGRRQLPKPPPRGTITKPVPDRHIRAWARAQGITVPATGRISTTLRQQYDQQHPPKKARNTHA